MKIHAAVLVTLQDPLEIAELEVPTLKEGQVLVELAFSGICHTQILEARGKKGPDPFLPHCIGHEGVGVVREVGHGVTKVKPGDRVLLSWIKGSGLDVPGTTYKWGSRTVNAGGVTTFSDYTVASENRLTLLPKGISPRSATFLGCAGATGLGVVRNTLQVIPGSTLAVFGCGGIGLLAIAGGTLAGCSKVIAVDVNPQKLELAKAFGATHLVHAGEKDVLQQIQEIAPRGLDYAVEASGKVSVMRQALESVRNQGGIAAVVGNAAAGEKLEVDPKLFNLGRQLRGTWGGDTVPDRDFPKYFELLSLGKLSLGPLISQEYGLEQINEALTDLEGGRVARPILALRDCL